MNIRMRLESSDGFSAIEMMVVVVLVGITTALAVPTLIGQRRLMRSVGVTREIATQLRNARQQAMSQRQAFTFQYDDTAKQIKIIDTNTRGTAVFDSSYPNNAGNSVVATIPLTSAGLGSTELMNGIPTLPTGANGPLGDGTSNSTLTSSKLNITFQPDGTVIDSSGNYANFALYIYNSSAPSATASAISVLGATGRVKIWRYNASANKYQE